MLDVSVRHHRCVRLAVGTLAVRLDLELILGRLPLAALPFDLLVKLKRRPDQLNQLQLTADPVLAAERLLDEARKAGWAEEKKLRAAAAKEAEVEAEKLVAESRSSVESVRAGATRRVEAGIKKVLEVITAEAAATRG